VFAPGLGTLTVVCPGLGWHLQLRGHQAQQGWERLRIRRERHAGKAHVAELHCKAQVVRWPSMLADDGKVGIAERVIPDQVVLGVRQREQAFLLGSRQNGTAGHTVSFFSKTLVCENASLAFKHRLKD